MVQLGYTVRFLTAQQFANSVVGAGSRSAIEQVLRPLLRCDLLVLDELGYLPMDPQVGPALYELMSTRYSQRATVSTSLDCCVLPFRARCATFGCQHAAASKGSR
jgi:DNA replication protein DnaC